MGWQLAWEPVIGYLSCLRRLAGLWETINTVLIFRNRQNRSKLTIVERSGEAMNTQVRVCDEFWLAPLARGGGIAGFHMAVDEVGGAQIELRPIYRRTEDYQ